MPILGFGVILSLILVVWVLPGLALPDRWGDGPHTVLLAQTSDPVETLQQHQQQLDQQRSEMQQEQERLHRMEKSAQEELGGLQHTIQATATEISDNEKKLNAANTQLKTLQKELAQAEATYQAQQSSTVARLRYLQRQKISNGWAVLLESENLNQFLDRRYQLRRVYQADRHMLETLQQDAQQLEQKQQQVATQKNQIALLMQELQAQKLNYEAQAQTQQTLIQRLQNDRTALEAAEEQLAKDSAAIATLIQQRLAEQARQSGVPPKGTGIMGYPSSGLLTSGFGSRVHPILGYTRFHAGVDFGADYGSPIWAADSGVVIFAGWYGGYGQSIIIDHGNKTTTLYGHTSEIYVLEGQTVQRGQVIAAVGSTGLSTGPHLHFEVRLSGEPTDPMNYL